MAEAPLEQMLGCEMRGSPIVCVDGRQLEVREKVAQVHGGQAQALDRFGHLKAFNASDDAVAAPILEPPWREVPEAAFLQEDGPGVVRTKIFGDSQQQTTPERARGFNEQRYAWTAGMFGIFLHAPQVPTRITNRWDFGVVTKNLNLFWELLTHIR
jgi:hypothetical protein